MYLYIQMLTPVIYQAAAKTNGRVNIPYGDEAAMADALAIHGPLAIAMDASRPAMTFYSRCAEKYMRCALDLPCFAFLIVGMEALTLSSVQIHN